MHRVTILEHVHVDIPSGENAAMASVQQSPRQFSSQKHIPPGMVTLQSSPVVMFTTQPSFPASAQFVAAIIQCK